MATHLFDLRCAKPGLGGLNDLAPQERQGQRRQLREAEVGERLAAVRARRVGQPGSSPEPSVPSRAAGPQGTTVRD